MIEMARSESTRRMASEILSLHSKHQYSASWIYSKARLTKALFAGEDVSSDFSEFLYIVTCGRSGSTLLRRLLIENYYIYIPPETYVLADLVRSFMTSAAMRWPDRVAMTLGRFQYQPEFETFGAVNMAKAYQSAVRLPISRRSLGGIVKLLFHQLGEDSDIEHLWLGDKTPANIFNIGLVQKIFPRARFLHIVRDPADVIDSIVRMEQHGGPTEAAIRWRDSITSWQGFERRLPASRRCEIKYEDLVSDAPVTLEVVSRSFGLPAREKRISVVDRLGDVGARPHHGNVLESVSPSEIGKGRARLSNEQRRVVGSVVNDLVGSYGYDLV